MGYEQHRRVRVAHLIHTMAYGGIETALVNWLKTLDRTHYDPYLYCFANPGGTETPFVEAASRHGLEVSKIPWSRWKPVFRAGQAMANQIRRRKIQILHCHNTYANLVGAYCGAVTPVKTVTTLYVWGEFGFKRNMLQYMDQLLIRRFDLVTAHCEDTFRATIARGFRAEDIRLLICGFAERVARLMPEERARRRAELGAGDHDVVFVNVSRFWPEKAHDVLLTAFRQVLNERPNAKLWLPGVGPEQEKIRALCTQLDLDPCVRFLGFCTELPELLAISDIQVHPSDMEGVPLAVCAGMAAGLPIIATAVGGLPEILQDGKSALLIPPRQPGTLARVMMDLMDDQPLQRRIGAEAQRFIEEEYSLRAATLRVQSVYKEMMSR